MNKPLTLLVFDIDGTLTDTTQVYTRVFLEAMTQIGAGPFTEKVGPFKHHTDSYIARYLYEQRTGEEFDKHIASEFEYTIADLLAKETIKEIAGAGALLHQLSQQTKYAICFATGSLLKTAQMKLDAINAKYEPQQLVASDQLEERVQIVQQAITNAHSHHGVTKFDRIISLGDGLWDLKTAQELGIDFIGVGNENVEVLKQNGMQNHLENFVNLNLDIL